MVDRIEAEIKQVIVANFLFGQVREGFSSEQSFLEGGIIDSTGLLELVAHVEQTYSISIADRELLPENLDSLANVSRFIARKLEHSHTQVAR